MTQKTVKFDEDVRKRALVAWCDYDGEGRDTEFFSSFFEAEANRQLATIPEDPSLVSLMCQIQRLRVGQSVEAFGVTLECRGNPLVVGAVFEVGKRYRTRGGEVAIVLARSPENRIYDISVLINRDRFSYVANGRYWSDGRESGYDLLPGAIEEPAPIAATIPSSEPAPDAPAPVFKVGDYARRRDGVVVGPLEVANNGPFKLRANGAFYKKSGMFLWHGEDALDLIEVVPAPCPASPPESPAPGLSDEELGREVVAVYANYRGGRSHEQMYAEVGAAVRVRMIKAHDGLLSDYDVVLTRAEKAEAALQNGASYMATAMRSFEGTEHEAMHRDVCSSFGLTITPAVAVPLTVKWSGK